MTPERVIYSGESTMVVTRTLSGEVAFLPHHAPFLGTLVENHTRIYLEDESATPLYGFPILVSPELRALSQSFEEYGYAAEALRVAMLKRQSVDRRLYGSAWEL